MAAEANPLSLSKDIERAVQLLQMLQNNPNMPRNKMELLQRVLESDFLHTVREVYEQISQTVDIAGPPELNAAAIAKSTVAAFAASEGHAHPRVVNLPKPEEGLGFNVLGGTEQNAPIYVSRIIPGGVADRQGELKRGDQLLAANGVNVEKETHERAVQLLKAAKDSVQLVVRYSPRVLDEMEARFSRSQSTLNR